MPIKKGETTRPIREDVKRILDLKSEGFNDAAIMQALNLDRKAYAWRLGVIRRSKTFQNYNLYAAHESITRMLKTREIAVSRLEKLQRSKSKFNDYAVIGFIRVINEIDSAIPRICEQLGLAAPAPQKLQLSWEETKDKLKDKDASAIIAEYHKIIESE